MTLTPVSPAAARTGEPEPDWSRLRAQLTGSLVEPRDPDYDAARRVFNAMIDRRPAAIARCCSTVDVRACLAFARARDIPVTVRGGGHNVAGLAVADGALLIDLAPMKTVELDEHNRVARAGAGLRLGEFIDAIEARGFVSPTGTDADTGLAGLTLGGGYGWLNGRFGLAVDNLAGAEIVLADGSVLEVNEISHPDLLWALRGGSGNFGVVTRFDLRVYPLDGVSGGMLLYPDEQAHAVFARYRELTANAPDELTAYFVLLTLPTGDPAVAIVVCWSGPLDEGYALLAPLRQWGAPVLDTIVPLSYGQMIRLLAEAAPPGCRDYWKQHLLRELSDELLDVLLDFTARKPSPRTALLIDHVHGAALRVAPDATAFPHRDVPHDLVMLGIWERPEEDAANIGWVRELAAATRRFATGGAYVNEAWDEQPESAFGANYQRLRDLKQRYDPGNIFRSTTNIERSARLT